MQLLWVATKEACRALLEHPRPPPRPSCISRNVLVESAKLNRPSCISRNVLVEGPVGTVVIILAGRPGVVVVRNFWGFTTARFTTAS